jgi:copper chaperone
MSTQDMHFEIDNLKCGGCEKTILKGLNALEGVTDVSVDHELQMVSLQADPAMREAIADKLQDMGYPEKGSIEGFEAGVSNIKSYVSCAIGKIS